MQELEQLPVRDVQLGDHLLVPRVCRFTLVSADASLERRDPAAQLALARSLLLPELEGSVDLELAGDVGSGMQRGNGCVRATLGLDACAERLRVERTRHHTHRGRVVDDAQAVRRESPTHFDVDRVVDALIVQCVADEVRALAGDPAFPEAAPVELLAVAQTLVGEHQPVDVGDEVHDLGRFDLGRPVGVAEDRDPGLGARVVRADVSLEVVGRGPVVVVEDQYHGRPGEKDRHVLRRAATRVLDADTGDLELLGELVQHRVERAVAGPVVDEHDFVLGSVQCLLRRMRGATRGTGRRARTSPSRH